MRKILTRCVMGAALGLSLVQVGCVTRGADFSSDISWVQKGKTTQSEVEKYLGAPNSVGNSGGTPTWTYGVYDYRLFGDSKTKELKFYWKDSKVEDFSFNSSFPEDRRRLIMKPVSR
ncbi:MAG: hypothetical protein EOP10_33620 [Proteobacteria bacterium]|nr:MAG: hypothetical protein EOP10_33620 [Pseudomonadota bacterium]